MNCKVWLVLSLLCICLRAELLLKHLAGPASEFNNFLPLDPADYPDIKQSSAIKVHLAAHHDRSVLARTVSLVVDSENDFRFSFFSPHSSLLELTLYDPKSAPVLLQGNPSFFPFGDEQVPSTVYIINEPLKGEYKLLIKSSVLNESTYSFLTSNPREDAYIILWNDSPLAISTTLNTFAHITGNQVGLVTTLQDSSLNGKVRKVQGHRSVKAVMNVQLPNGVDVDVPMQDDGLHADGEASDGVYGALIPAIVAGQYIFEAAISGTDQDGVAYSRTSTQLVRVVPRSLSITGRAMAVLDSTRARILMQIAVAAPLNQQYYAYTEVWGIDDSGADVPVAWIGGMTNVQSVDGTLIELELDINWISMAGAHEPLTLRNVMIKDTDYFVPIAQYEEIPVKTMFDLEEVLNSQQFKKANDEITEEMLEGRRPATNISAAAETVYLVLCHGYCSSTNPFAPPNPSTWTNGKFFLKAGANMLNNVFASNVISWAQQNNLKAYSFIGHSQGGMVGAHMKQFYWSGLDHVQGGRVVQSIGTPFQGCSAAGTAANLGYLFGVSCGANDNLTPTGALSWLQTISEAARREVSFYTTTYAQGQPFGDYCNLPMNLLLDFPNDGTTEFDRALLPGATNMGNTQRYCHTGSMKYPAQYLNDANNKVMNTNAAKTYKA